MNYFLQGFGVFLGVIAGTFVVILVQKFTVWRQEEQKVKNLKFELNLNIKKIDEFLEKLTNYRNKTNSDNLADFFDYFDLSRVIWITTTNMFYSGLLYKYLKYEDIGKLQVMISEFSLYWENIINGQVEQNKKNLDKQKTIKDIDFWENKFKRHKKSLNEISGKPK